MFRHRGTLGKLGPDPDERLDPTGTGSARLLHHLLWKRKSKVARFREQSGLIMGLFFLFDVVIILIVLSYFYFLEHVNIGAKAKQLVVKYFLRSEMQDILICLKLNCSKFNQIYRRVIIF